jgi:hypothetical protein
MRECATRLHYSMGQGGLKIYKVNQKMLDVAFHTRIE